MIKIDPLNSPLIWYILLINHMDIFKLLHKMLYSCTIESTYTKCMLNTLYYYSLSRLSNKAKVFPHTHKPSFMFSRKTISDRCQRSMPRKSVLFGSVLPSGHNTQMNIYRLYPLPYFICARIIYADIVI